jgi:hypothetical protein
VVTYLSMIDKDVRIKKRSFSRLELLLEGLQAIAEYRNEVCHGLEVFDTVPDALGSSADLLVLGVLLLEVVALELPLESFNAAGGVYE